ncbi:hypothetical protein B1748_14660 [Paenibacillus sp. MY03]|nr:hypothetical protein B1748_14660 [Paenibacillus sp. MY03]
MKPLSFLLVITLLLGLITSANLAMPIAVQAAGGILLDLDFQMNNMDSSAHNTAGDTTSTSGLAVQINIDPDYVHEGSGSKKWILAIPDQANPGSLVPGSAMIYSKEDLSVDLNSYDILSFWAYSVKQRTGNQTDRPVEIRFYMKGDASAYYYYRLMLDWTGWKKIEIPLATIKMQITGAPKPFGPLDYLRFNPIALGSTTNDPELAVYLDDFRLTGSGELFPAVADKPSGTYMNKVKVNLVSASTPPGANRIYYKRSGVDNDFQLYSGALELTQTTELVVKSVMNGVSSAETTYTYTVDIDPNFVGEVKAAPEAGTFPQVQNVTLTSESEDAQIYYKYEGEEDSAYRLYNGPIVVDENAVLVTKAMIGSYSSELMAYAYTIDLSSAGSTPLGTNENFTTGSIRWTNTTNAASPAAGQYSGYWANPATPIDIVGHDGTNAGHITELNQIQWQNYDQIEFWLYSEKASNKKVYFLLYANDPATPSNEYFMTSFFVDWKGWKKIELPFNKFLNSTGTAEMSKISKLIVHPQWYGSDPAPDPTDKLYFDNLALAKNVVEPSIKQISQSALPGSALHYSLSLKNIGEASTAYNLTTESGFGTEYLVTYDSVTEVVEVGRAIDIEFEVQVPADADPGETRKAIISVQPSAGGKALKLELNVSVGSERIATKQHPYIMTTKEQLEESREKIEHYDWAADYLEAVKAKADVWLEKEIYYPTQPAGQTTWFVCGDTTLTYNYDSPNRHLCPATNEYVTGDQVDAGWRFTTHTLNTEAARNLAIVYALTGEEKYADKAKEILVRYSELYPSYPVQPQYGKLFFQTLDEAVQMIQLVQAYDLIKPSGVLDVAESYGIEQNLFAASAKTLQGYDVGKSNWQTWHNAAIGAIGAVLEDKTLMDFSVLGRSGFDYQMTNSVLSDGFWYEGAIGYHFYAQMALLLHAQSLKEMGYDLFGNANFKKTFDVTLQYAYPDLGIINSNDSGKYPTNLGAPGRVVPMDYEAVYAEYNDSSYAALLNTLYIDKERPPGGYVVPNNSSSGIVGEQAVFYGKTDIASGGSLPSESLNFEGLGHSVIRVGEGNDQLFALVDYGLHGGYHGHPDKLHLDIFGKGERLAPDLGIPPYSNSMYTSYYKMTFSHNTVAVDGKTQNIPTVNNVESFEPTKLYLPSESFGIMTNTSSKAYDNMSQYERTVAVTPDYMIDLFDVASASERQFDWIMRGIGSFETDGEMEPMTETLGTEDAYSFFRNGQSAQADGIWEGTWRTPAGNGLKLFSLTSSAHQPTTMIVGESPGPGNDTDAYTPTVVNRVNGTEARYVSVLEPFSGESKIQSVRRLNSKPIEQIEVKLTDGRTNLFQYEFGELEPGQLQYVFLEGAELDTSDVSPLAYMDSATLNVTLNNGVEFDRGTFVVYAPGAEQVRWNGKTTPFTSNNGYVMIHVETEEEPAATPEPSPSESTGSTPPPASTPKPSATPKPTNTPKPSATQAPTPKPSAKPGVNDIGGHWANKQINEAIEHGIAQGFGDGTFRPNQSVTREQFIVMIMNALRPNEEASAAPPFMDGADISSWATRAIALADEMGLMSGYEDGTFRPKNELTRSQLAVILARALGPDAPNADSASGYADEATIPAWARPAARLLKELGIMNGRTGNLFAPLDQVTRAEAVTVILRLVRYLEEDE